MKYFNIDIASLVPPSTREKKAEICSKIFLTPYSNITFQKAKKQHKKRHLKPAITQRLRTDLGRLVGITTAIQLVSINQLTGLQPSIKSRVRLL